MVGLGSVGQWILRRLESERESLAVRYGLAPTVVSVANARDGFVHRADGLDTATVLALASGRGSLSEHPGVAHWPRALDGLRETECDALVEVASSPEIDGEPGRSHMRVALERGIPVITSNKWPVALHGLELSKLAHEHGTTLRAESTVMSGTPVLGTLVEGLAGASPTAIRGILNSTVNFILQRMGEGRTYEEALAEAQRSGLAERDPAADVEGRDAVAKLMILAALVLGRQLESADVGCRGITDLTPEELADARSGGQEIKHVASLVVDATGARGPTGGLGSLSARVEPLRIDRDDPLARVDGAINALICRADPVGEVTVIGPGAGRALAGQGVLSDLIAVATGTASRSRRTLQAAGGEGATWPSE